MLNLSVAEVRVLGVLIEKEITTPEYYPLSLNAVVNACNQKSNRDPVLELTEADARSALFELENLGLVRVLADARVSKFEHLAYNKLNLRRPEIAVLGLLLLRGPQTAAELRARAERMYAFDDTAAVLATLERLAARAEEQESLAVQMPRQPGARESRWMHLLAGAVEAAPGPRYSDSPASEPAPATDLNARVLELEQMVADLHERVQQLERMRSDQPA